MLLRRGGAGIRGGPDFMQEVLTQPTDGSGSTAATPAGAASELQRLRATCRRQAHVIETLGDAVRTFSEGAAALKSQISELGAENQRLRSRPAARRFTSAVPSEAARRAEARLPLDVEAPAAARAIVHSVLHDRVP